MIALAEAHGVTVDTRGNRGSIEASLRAANVVLPEGPDPATPGSAPAAAPAPDFADVTGGQAPEQDAAVEERELSDGALPVPEPDGHPLSEADAVAEAHAESERDAPPAPPAPSTAPSVAGSPPAPSTPTVPLGDPAATTSPAPASVTYDNDDDEAPLATTPLDNPENLDDYPTEQLMHVRDFIDQVLAARGGTPTPAGGGPSVLERAKAVPIVEHDMTKDEASKASGVDAADILGYSVRGSGDEGYLVVIDTGGAKHAVEL